MQNRQSKEEWFAQKFSWLKRGVLVAAIGTLIGVPLIMTKIQGLSSLGGLVLILSLIWLIGLLMIIPFLHWKDRYRGERSTLWVVFLVIETSGWFKIIYWFRHIFPDRKGTGRYANDAD